MIRYVSPLATLEPALETWIATELPTTCTTTVKPDPDPLNLLGVMVNGPPAFIQLTVFVTVSDRPVCSVGGAMVKPAVCRALWDKWIWSLILYPTPGDATVTVYTVLAGVHTTLSVSP